MSAYPRTSNNQNCRCGSREKYMFCCKNKEMLDKLCAMYTYQCPDEDAGILALSKMFPTHGFRRPREDEEGHGTDAVYSWEKPTANVE